MAVPYERQFADLVVEADQDYGCFALPFPNRTFIDKILVTQRDGTPVEFTVELFNREVACEGYNSESVSADEIGDERHYLIGPKLTSSSHVVENYADPPIAFVSQEPVIASRAPGLQGYQIFMRITPASAGDYVFEASLRGSSDV